MRSSGPLLWLLIFSFMSSVASLNPDDPNVCSHWERSVPVPVPTPVPVPVPVPVPPPSLIIEGEIARVCWLLQ